MDDLFIEIGKPWRASIPVGIPDELGTMDVNSSLDMGEGLSLQFDIHKVSRLMKGLLTLLSGIWASRSSTMQKSAM